MIKTRILFIVPARLGDALMITPALALLKKHHPEYMIDVLAFGRLGASVYQDNPNSQYCFLIEEIESLDQFIKKYVFIVAAHRDKKTLGLIERLNKPIVLIEPADQQQQQAQQALNFIQNLFTEDNANPAQPIPYQVFANHADETYAQTLINPQKSYIGLHLGCHGINKAKSWLSWRAKTDHKKTWQVTQFVELAQLLKKHYPEHQLVLTGGESEQQLAKKFLKIYPDALNCVGKTSVQQLAILIRYLSLYICGDTGSMHLACTGNTPLIALFGPTNSIRTGPYPPTPFRRVIQAEVMQKISPNEVLKVTKELLNS